MATSTYKIWVDRSDSPLNPDALTQVNGITYARGTVTQYEEAVAFLGLHQIDVVDNRPDDFSDDDYFRTEPTSAPWVVSYIPKEETSKKDTHNSRSRARIASIEQETLMPRSVREFMLDLPDVQNKAWYIKLVEVNDKIIDLRGKLKP